MKKWQSYSALKRVKNETENLTAALANALEMVIVTPAGEAKSLDGLAEPVTAFAIIPGILRLLEYPDIALLADDILDLLQDTLNQSDLDSDRLDARLQIAFVATTDLPALLEDALVQSGDDFAKVFHLINQVRKSWDRAVVFDSRALAAQKTSFKKQYAATPDKMKTVLARQSSLFLKAGRALLDEPGNTRAVTALRGVTSNMEMMFRDYRLGTLWGLAAGIIDTFQESSDENAVKTVFALGKPLHLLATGDLTQLDTVDDNILARMLDVVSASTTQSRRLTIIRQWYGLDRHAARQIKNDFRSIQVKYARKSALKNSLRLINEDINRLVDTINMMIETSQLEADKVREVYQGVYTLREVLAFLRMNFLVEHIDAALAPEPVEPLDDALSQAAGVLFVVNKELVDKLENMEREVFSAETAITETSTLGSARLHVYLTAMTLLETVITDIDSYVDNHCQGSDLQQARDILAELARVFTVVSLPEQKQYLVTASDYVDLVIRGAGKDDMPDATFNALSHLVINSLWYLEQLSIGREQDSRAYLEKSGRFAAILQEFVDTHPAPEQEDADPGTGREVDSDLSAVPEELAATETTGLSTHSLMAEEAFPEPVADTPVTDSAPAAEPGREPDPVEALYDFPDEDPVPVDVPDYTPGDNPDPAEQPVPAPEPAEQPGDSPPEEPSRENVPVEEPYDTPDENPVPVEEPDHVPGDAPDPDEEPVPTPEPAEQPGDSPPEEPGREHVPVEEPHDTPAEEDPVPVEEPEEIPGDEPDPVEEPGPEPEPIEEPGDTPQEAQEAQEAPSTLSSAWAAGDENDEDDEDIKAIFAEEFDEVLENLREELASLSQDYQQPRAIKDCCRYFHTLKGSGRMVGADTIGTLSFAMEKLYDSLGEQQGTSDDAMALTHRVLDTLPAMKANFMDASVPAPAPELIRQLCEEAVSFMTPEAAAEIEIPVLESVVAATDITAVESAPVEAPDIPIVTDSVPTLNESVDMSQGEFLDDSGSEDTGGDNLALESADADTPAIEAQDNEHAVVSKELSEINNRISTILAGDDDTPVTSDLLVPLHTLYGIARMEHMENYTNAVRAMESFQEHHPHKAITADMALVFQDFCMLTEKLARHLARGGDVEYADLAFDAMDLERALADLSGTLRQGTTGQDGVSEPAENDEAGLDPVIAGFLREARSLVARLEQETAQLDVNSPSQPALDNLTESLHLLAGAAEMAELDDVEKVAASMEAAYSQAARQDAGSDFTLQTLLAEGLTWLKTVPEQLGAGDRPRDDNELCDRLMSALAAPLAQEAPLEYPAEAEAPGASVTVETTGSETAREQTEAQAQDTAGKDLAGAEEAVDQELLDIFLDEAEEILEAIDGLYLRWQEGDESVIDEYLRHLHTLKGSSALVREMDMSRGAHDFETFIIDARNARQGYDADFFTACDRHMQGLQEIHKLYSRDDDGLIVKTCQAATSVEATAAIAQDSAAVTSAPVASPEVAATASASPSPDPAAKLALQQPVQSIQAAAEEQVRVSNRLLKNLMNDADEINFSRNRIEKNFHDIGHLLVDMDETLHKLRSYVKRFEDKARESYTTAVQENTEEEAGRISDDFDSLEMDRYTELHEMSLSLTEDYDDLQDIRMNLAGRLKDIDHVLLGQQRLTNSLQDGLISSQMVPFSSIVPRLRRLVRQISRDLQKEVRFEVENQQGNLDKNVLQAIITPLEHLIRNALDHGIESPDERMQAGKQEQAVLSVSVTRAGASILIEIRDDGRGINVEKVKHRAVERGLLDADAEISHDAACQLIFKPGFSTADAVSSISGRGVGLDVVKSEITQIGGSVEISSTQGQGTAFVIQLPLTTSLNRSLMFEVQGNRYVVLMNTLDGVKVEKLSRILQKLQEQENAQVLDQDKDENQDQQIAPTQDQASHAATFEYGGKHYEYVYLGTMLNLEFQTKPESVDASIPMLLVSGRDRSFALHIDRIIESRDLVVKSFSKQFAAMPGIGGGVIMPDSHVAIVLDLVTLVNQYAEDSEATGDAGFQSRELEPAKGEKGRQLVMVVDDSITVRKVTSATLKRHGLDVITAKNGLEAIAQLELQVPDIILLDIEMPKMDGFETATHIRKQAPPIGDIPIIMITSRIGDKHRSRAQEIGVNEFMSKPFVEQVLLEHIRSYQNK